MIEGDPTRIPTDERGRALCPVCSRVTVLLSDPGEECCRPGNCTAWVTTVHLVGGVCQSCGTKHGLEMCPVLVPLDPEVLD